MEIGLFMPAMEFFKILLNLGMTALKQMLFGYSGTHRNLCKFMKCLLYEYYKVGLARLFEGACPNCL